MKDTSLLRSLVVAGLLTGITYFSHAQTGAGPNSSSSPHITIVTPTNGAVFGAPADITISALIIDTNSFVNRITFLEGTNVLASMILDPGPGGTHSTSNTVSFTWSGVVAGDYVLTVRGTDLNGVTGTSAPVSVLVGSHIPVVTIVATDPTASVAGDTGTLTVYRTGNTNNSITVFYNISGTASNGVDYATLPNIITIPAGATSALITVTPIVDPSPDFNETVVLHLMPSPGAGPTTYIIGNPSAAVVTILGNTNEPPEVSIIVPTNGAGFTGTTNILILAAAHDADGFVQTVEFFAGAQSLGIVTNSPIAVDPPVITAAGPSVFPLYAFHLLWTNVPAGNNVLTAVATDNGGATATSSPVNISVTTNHPPPPTNIPPIVRIESPTNGASFHLHDKIQICAAALDVDGFVTTVQFFAGSHSLGIVTNFPIVVPNDPSAGTPAYHLLCITWTNASAGAYALTAVATDNLGAMTTSSPVNITLTTNLPPSPTNIPPMVAIVSPIGGEVFPAPGNVLIYASAHDPDGFVHTVEFFENGTSLGMVTNNPMAAGPITGPTANGSVLYPVNPFRVLWTNVPVGHYTLSAVATDNGGATATSGPVTIFVVTPSNVPPVVTIIATDPIAVEGTNFFCVPPTAAIARYCSGTNTATFLVHRTGDTSSDLMVDYSIGGTALNGTDYVTLPGYVIIPAGRSFALITIIPLDDIDPVARRYDTVILSVLALPTAVNSPLTYSIGWPGKAEAIILEDHDMPGPVTGLLPDGSFHVSVPGTNGQNYCLQVSTDLIHWTTVCTNTVVKGSIQFADPETGSVSGRYYRVVPAAGAPVY